MSVEPDDLDVFVNEHSVFWDGRWWLTFPDDAAILDVYATYECIRDDHADATHILIPAYRYKRMCEALQEHMDNSRRWKNRASSQRHKAKRLRQRLTDLGVNPYTR